jgi:3-oxoacyl-[acyl-carrier-protein] synthase II
MPERIVVVGSSAVTCLGPSREETWSGLIAGRSGLARVEQLGPDRFLQDIAGIVPDVGPGRACDDPALSRLPARFLHLGLLAARQAWRDSGLVKCRELDPTRVAVVVGSAMGGLDVLDFEHAAAQRRRTLATSPYLIPGMIINQAAGQIAEHLKLLGPSLAPANACATGGHTVALGASLLRGGEADVALCGACESAFTPLVVNGFATMKALLGRKADDRSRDDPAQASRPFSVDRAGFVLAEGAAMMVLATAAAARRLGLCPQAELAGWASNTDAHHMAIPDAASVVRCLSLALRRAEVSAPEVGYYNAHGTSTQLNDRVESEAIKQVFGAHARTLAVSSIKGALGHGLGAASAIEAVVAVEVLKHGVIPPTLNFRRDPELDLDYVPDVARSHRAETVVSASFGFGGTNNALVFRRMEDV